MITVFTLCSANYLAHAKTLGDSLREHNPDFHFVIGLVDRLPKELPSGYLDAFEVIPVEEVPMPEFEIMFKKYNIVELNTAVKPFYMEFLYQRNPLVEVVIYLDPDILVCGSFGPLLDKLKQNSIVLTPHLCSYDNSAANIYYEKAVLANGIFNLGFIATSCSEETNIFLNWWQIRLQDHCHYRSGVAGSFFDQLWINLAPIYFRGVHIETNPGYNMCHWNHFERHLSLDNGHYMVNKLHELIFFHFSGYKPEQPDVCVNRPGAPVASFIERPDLHPIYDDYNSRLLARNYNLIKLLPWHFNRPTILPSKRNIKMLIRNLIKLW